MIIYIIIGIEILILIIFGVFYFLSIGVLTKCKIGESYSCPSFKCDISDDQCGFAPYRCINTDANNSTCSGSNKMCMTYPVTANMTASSTS